MPDTSPTQDIAVGVYSSKKIITSININVDTVNAETVNVHDLNADIINATCINVTNIIDSNDSSGYPGEILSIGDNGLEWISDSTVSNIYQVLTVDNDASGESIINLSFIDLSGNLSSETNNNFGLIDSSGIQFNYDNDTTIYYSGMNLNGLTSTKNYFDMNFNGLTFKNVVGTTGQVIVSDANSNPTWQDITSPNLSAVLDSSNNANYKAITNLSSLEIQKDLTSSGSITLSQTSTNIFDLTSVDHIENVLESGPVTKEFSGNYMKLSIQGTIYYLPLYKDESVTLIPDVSDPIINNIEDL
jgi:hypothetical protein